jgi:hypothetical protein
VQGDQRHAQLLRYVAASARPTATASTAVVKTIGMVEVAIRSFCDDVSDGRPHPADASNRQANDDESADEHTDCGQSTTVVEENAGLRVVASDAISYACVSPTVTCCEERRGQRRWIALPEDPQRAGFSRRDNLSSRLSASIEPRSFAFWYQARAIAMSAKESGTMFGNAVADRSCLSSMGS